jgi:ASC-1-like (ASCH) protein
LTRALRIKSYQLGKEIPAKANEEKFHYIHKENTIILTPLKSDLELFKQWEKYKNLYKNLPLEAKKCKLCAETSDNRFHPKSSWN